MSAPTSNATPSSTGATYGVAVTPSDSVSLSLVCSALYIGAAGTVAVVQADGTVVSFVGALAGSIIPIQCKRVNATGTTASSIVALYQS